MSRREDCWIRVGHQRGGRDRFYLRPPREDDRSLDARFDGRQVRTGDMHETHSTYTVVGPPRRARKLTKADFRTLAL